MTLTNVEVYPNLEIDVVMDTRSVVIRAVYGDTQRAAFISRDTIDNSFPQYHLTNEERVGLVESKSNLTVICGIISAKYARGESYPHRSAGSTILRIDVDDDDLRRGPTLSDDYLLLARGAGYRRRS